MSKLLRFFSGASAGKERFYKYIIYAIGEVVLIVVGILVAVNIDNWNDSRRNMQAIDKISGTVCDDLREDIGQYEFLLRRHYWLDSLLRRVIDGTLTEDEYRSNWKDLHPLIVRSYSFYEHRNGYTALQAMVDNIPDDFHGIYGELTDYYLYTVTDAVYVLEREDRLVWKTIEDWERYDWNYLTRKPGINADKLDYLLHSPEYKNKAMTFFIKTGNIIALCEGGRYTALELYLDLSRYRNIPPDSTFNKLQEVMNVESPIELTPCDSSVPERIKSSGIVKSIGLFRNRSEQPANMRVWSGDDEDGTEIAPSSVNFYEFAKGDVVRVMNSKGECLGYVKVGTNNFAVDLPAK